MARKSTDPDQDPLADRLASLRRRLRHLGVTRGDEVPSRAPVIQRGPDIEALVKGVVDETPAGSCFRTVRLYPGSTRHGGAVLTDWLTLAPATLAALAGDPRVAHAETHQVIFLDTETTGLGGSGTLVFEVGIGRFDTDGNFEVHQFFLRDPAEEPAMLHRLTELIPSHAVLATFNGRSFDVPLLAGRLVLNRRPPTLEQQPNLDLLMPARRLWKRRLPSCALSSLEGSVLGLHRSGEDVPGYLIPALYNDYLRTRDARQMVRVLYHNEMDILSMVSLGVRLARAFEAPDDPLLHVEDRLSLARWYEAAGSLERAEAAYRAALEQAPDALTRYEALAGLASLLKSANRRAEAEPLWADLADLHHDIRGHEELAKYYEWHHINLAQALEWTERGLRLAESWYPGLRRTEALRALTHRRSRLLRKIAGQGDGYGGGQDAEE
ncbi:MAG: metal-dependent exonucleaseMrfB [Anaerolineae bacterium]